jgi:hypothetical protein
VPSTDNRIFKFDSKTPQRLVGAAALLVAAFTLWQILWPLRYSLLATWLVIEVIFYVFYWRPRCAAHAQLRCLDCGTVSAAAKETAVEASPSASTNTALTPVLAHAHLS